MKNDTPTAQDTEPDTQAAIGEDICHHGVAFDEECEDCFDEECDED